MRLLNHPIRAGAVAVLGLAMTATTGALASTAASAAPAASTPAFSALARSVVPTTDKVTGAYTSRSMSVEVALHPGTRPASTGPWRRPTPRAARATTTGWRPASSRRRFAPTAASRAAVASYLRSAGLKVSASSSPFLVRATGSSAQVAAAFRTKLSTYRAKKGIRYFSNSAAVALPATLAGYVQGVIGLTNTIRDQQSMVKRAKSVSRPAAHAARSSAAPASCEGALPDRLSSGSTCT